MTLPRPVAWAEGSADLQTARTRNEDENAAAGPSRAPGVVRSGSGGQEDM